MRELERPVEDGPLEGELLRAGEVQVDRRRGRGGLLLVRGRLVLRRRVGDAYGGNAPVANRLRVVLTPEYEDPDRDTSQQANARDKPPTPLYGAEDVLNAQDSPSALQLRRKGSS